MSDAQPDQPALAQRALAAYELPPIVAVSALPGGLINETWLVETAAAPPRDRAVLQRVSPIFGRAVHDDIEAITAHLQARGLLTPRLYRTRSGELSVEVDGALFRLMTFIPGQTHKVMTPALARPAGQLVGRFHAALSGLSHRFHFVRPGAHDLAGHLDKLRQAVAEAAQPDFAPREAPVPPELFALAEALLRRGETMPLKVELPLRLCHGDLKVSNLRFDDRGAGLCLLDLDTLAHLPLAFELGDALRSWCNPRGEDVAEGAFDLEICAAALDGYAEPAAAFLTAAEARSIIPGVERIAFQLAVRFAVDVVRQDYFRWDPGRFPSRAAHNLIRAAGQWSLCRSIADQRAAAEAIAARLTPRSATS
jgi:Ser/Thr protein kinase RdoA (MazF antagonist)